MGLNRAEEQARLEEVVLGVGGDRAVRRGVGHAGEGEALGELVIVEEAAKPKNKEREKQTGACLGSA